MNFIFLLIGLLLVIVLFQIFRSSEILGVATKKISKSFEDSNNRYNAILGVIFLIGLIFSIFWYWFGNILDFTFYIFRSYY